jgi:hypothetical protein
MGKAARGKGYLGMALHGDGHVNDKALQGSLHQPHHRGRRLGAANINVHLKVIRTPATCTAGLNKRMLHLITLTVQAFRI